MRANVKLQEYRAGETLRVWNSSGGFSSHHVIKRFKYLDLLNIVKLNYPELSETQLAERFTSFCIENGYLTEDETVGI